MISPARAAETPINNATSRSKAPIRARSSKLYNLRWFVVMGSSAIQQGELEREINKGRAAASLAGRQRVRAPFPARCVGFAPEAWWGVQTRAGAAGRTAGESDRRAARRGRRAWARLTASPGRSPRALR